jgi:hypothetical protein
MPAYNKSLKTAADEKIGPQFFDDDIDDWTFAKGSDGAPFYRERGSIAMEAWNGSADITKTFTGNRYGFSVINDGSADLTFTLNSQTRTVKPGEQYYALFDAFTTVTIAATSAYRAEVLR